MGDNIVLERVKKESRRFLGEIEAKEILKSIGVGTTDTRLATTKEEAIALSRELGFPVVLKIVSPDITHKSDIGGVKLGLKNEDEVSRAYAEIMTSVRQNNPTATIQGVSVQPLARPGVEIIIGTFKDRQFGPVLMFGIGGVMVEILKDVSFRIIPITRWDAGQMIREIKGFPLLQGYRGQEPANTEVLEDLLLKVSNFVERNPEVSEMDLNPIFAYKDSAVAVDARIILE